jgi:hypothetical protein
MDAGMASCRLSAGRRTGLTQAMVNEPKMRVD